MSCIVCIVGSRQNCLDCRHIHTPLSRNTACWESLPEGQPPRWPFSFLAALANLPQLFWPKGRGAASTRGRRRCLRPWRALRAGRRRIATPSSMGYRGFRRAGSACARVYAGLASATSVVVQAARLSNRSTTSGSACGEASPLMNCPASAARLCARSGLSISRST